MDEGLERSAYRPLTVVPAPNSVSKLTAFAVLQKQVNMSIIFVHLVKACNIQAASELFQDLDLPL